MVHGTVKGFFRLLEAFVLILVVGGSLLAWRLSQGPLALDFLTPYIEDALADPAGGFTVRLERTQLTWAGWEKALDLRAVGVHALVRDRGVVASVPEVAVTMSGRALLRAELAPSAIEIIGPRIRLFRDSGGEVHWGLGEGGPGEAAGVVDRLIAQLQGGVEGPIASLRRLEIVGGELVIEDAVLGFTWHAPDADIKLRRDADGISADLGVHIDFGDEKPRLRGMVRWDRFTGKLAGAATFGDVRPAAFAPALPELARLSAIDMPLAGSVAFAFHPASGIETLSLDLTGAGGALRVPEPLAATYPLETLHLKLAASDYFATLRVDEFFADLGGPTVSASAVADRVGTRIAVKADATVARMPVDALDRFWPPSLAPDVRSWIVANLSHGMVREAQATLSADIAESGEITIGGISGRILPEGVTVRYLGELPEVKNASAVATFDRNRFRLAIKGGEVYGLRVTGGTIDFTGLNGDGERAAIDLAVVGPLADALRLVDHRPLGYAKALGIDPETTSGTAATHLTLRFPLLKALSLEDVTIHARSTLKDVTVPRILFDRDVTGGDLAMVVTREGMDVTGRVAVAGAPAEMSWRENFGDAESRSRYALRSVLDDRQRAALGLDFAPFQHPFLTGAVPVEVVALLGDDGTGLLEAKLDLTGSAMGLPQIAWQKPMGRAASAAVRARLQGGRMVEVNGFTVSAGEDLAATGSVILNGEGGVERIEIGRFRCGRTDVRATARLLADGGVALDVAGASFDAAPLFDAGLANRVAGSGPEEERDDTPALSVTGAVDRLWLGEETYLENVTAALASDGGEWRTGRLHGFAPGGKIVAAELSPRAEGRVVSMTSADAGAVFRAFGAFDNMVGGKLDVRAVIGGRDPGAGITGRIAVSDYHVVKAPLLARLLSVAALTGIGDLLRGDGISFSTLDLPFSLRGGRFELNEMRAFGPALGITANGALDLKADTLSLEGTIVPIYAFNSILGNVPVLGQILTPEKGGGVFAATYGIKGKADDPAIVVNPLAALAPGFLRGLFNILPEGGGRGGG